jgi:hypothetical protein
MSEPHPAERYLGLLIAGDADAVVSSFAAHPVVEDPRAGRVEGADAVAQFMTSTAAWLADKSAAVTHVRTTKAGRRTVAEQILQVGDIELPVAVVALDEDAGTTALHVYHTMWPFNRVHTVRPHFVEPEPDAQHSDVVKQFAMALGGGDIDAALALFEADMYMREASGPPYVHWGASSLRAYFQGLFDGGAPTIQKNTVTDDGRCACMEFSAIGWGGQPWPPERHQAGLAVYERGDPGRLRAIRIYDDIKF